MFLKINFLLWFLWTFEEGNAPTVPMTASTEIPVNVSTNVAATTMEITSQTTSSSTKLSCYDCSESFKYLWEPYTECQYYPTHAPLRECLDSDIYCKVERVSYKSMTVSITRGCTKECWHGCYASGFGLTKLKCTSCCLTPGCNVGNVASGVRTNLLAVLILALALHSTFRALRGIFVL